MTHIQKHLECLQKDHNTTQYTTQHIIQYTTSHRQSVRVCALLHK